MVYRMVFYSGVAGVVKWSEACWLGGQLGLETPDGSKLWTFPGWCPPGLSFISPGPGLTVVSSPMR